MRTSYTNQNVKIDSNCRFNSKRVQECVRVMPKEIVKMDSNCRFNSESRIGRNVSLVTIKVKVKLTLWLYFF